MRARLMALFGVLVLILAACGGGDTTADTTAADTPTDNAASTDETEAPAPETTTTAAEASSDGGGSGGGGGGDITESAGDTTVTVDGESLSAQALLRCIPFSEMDTDLDLQILGDGFQVFVYVTDTSNEVSLQGRAVGENDELGVFSNSAFSFDGTTYTDDATGEALVSQPVTWTGDRVSGSMVVYDSYGSGDTRTVTFDAPVPSEVQDCSL